ncbi:MAG: aminodeoxychorismate lyase [Alphaproteobacteria bacterium]
MDRAAPNILINGRPGDSVAVQDRGFQYGDGVFETIKVTDGSREFWGRHMARLGTGCARLGLPPPDERALEREAAELSKGVARGVLKIIVTRGTGGRGYRPPELPEPTRVVSLHPWPDYPDEYWQKGVRVRLCEAWLSDQPLLAGIKHLNRLEQIVARQEWDDPDVAEGLMRDAQGFVVEGTMTNLFLVKGRILRTPEIDRCGVAGVMRAVILDLADRLSIPAVVGRVSVAEAAAADSLFLTNSVIGIWPVRAFEETTYAPSALTRRLVRALEQAAKTEP